MMININWTQTKKQAIAWKYLTDKIITELMFGGGAGGSKTFLGCAFLIITCGMYPGIRNLLGRKELKRLKGTTLKTMFEIFKRWEIKEGVHYKYNDQKSEIQFTNGSEIVLIDLDHLPSDPEYDRLGSLEITFAFIDEIAEITFKCWEVVNSRRRYKIKEYGLTPKTLGSCNPTVNWAKQEFYTPWKKGKLEKHRMFVKALAKDNPFLPKSYIKMLGNIKIKATRERLLNGNWDYDDDKSALFSYDVIMDCVGREISLFAPYIKRISDLKRELDELPETEINKRQEVKILLEAEEKKLDRVKNVNKFIIGDVARKGRDKMPLGYWEGLELIEIVEVPQHIQEDTTKSSKFISDYATKKGVRKSHILLDEGGVGGGVVDQVKCKGFLDASSAIQPPEAKYDKTKEINYGNLRAQCSFELAFKMEEGLVGFNKKIFDNNPEMLETLTQEFQQIKQRDIDKDANKIYITKKEIIIANIKRSPDIFDMIKMRMWFELSHGSSGGLLVA